MSNSQEIIDDQASSVQKSKGKNLDHSRTYVYDIYSPDRNSYFTFPRPIEICGATLRIKSRNPSVIVDKFALIEDVNFTSCDWLLQCLELETIRKLDQVGIFSQDQTNQIETDRYKYIKLPLYFIVDPENKQYIFEHTSRIFKRKKEEKSKEEEGDEKKE